MEQQQIKVSFSLGTKLLISVVTLLLVVIGFLDVSTILLLKEDRKAYTYQTQATEALLASKEFTGIAKRSLDTLRLSLSTYNPLNRVRPQQQGALEKILNSQSEIAALHFFQMKRTQTRPQATHKTIRTDLLQKAKLTSSNLEIRKDWWKFLLPEIEKNEYSFFNQSQIGTLPIVGVAFTDNRSKKSDMIPIVVAFIPLTEFGRELKGSNVTVATSQGWVVYDTDPSVLYTQKNVIDLPIFEAAFKNKFTTGAQEYDFKGERYLGSFVRPGFNLVVLSNTKFRKAMAATYTMTEKFILLGCMAIGIAIIFAILFSKTLTAPLNRLYEATKQVAAGNFDLNLKSNKSDEIGALSSSFNVMSGKINELIEESMERVRIEGEVAIASTVQQTLIPPKEFQNQNLQIHSHYQSASECGGDWWGFFGVQDKVALLIADATGHGLPSALITAAARSCFSFTAKLAQEDPEFAFSPGAMLSYANRCVYDAAQGKIMMTFFGGVFDFSTNKFTYSSAGHNPPWLLSGAGGGKPKLKSLVAKGQRLGEARDVQPFPEKTVDFQKGDIFFFYTDGLLEGKNTKDEEYGKKQTRKIVEAQYGSGPKAIIETLMDDFMKHNGSEKPLDDDVTLAAAKILS